MHPCGTVRAISAATTEPRPARIGDRSLPLPAWVAAWVGFTAVAGAAVATLGLTGLDRHQQLPLVSAVADGHLARAYADHGQTSGPGALVVLLPVYLAARMFASEGRAFDIASLACWVPLAVAACAASRAVGTAARSARELLSVGAIVLGVPVLACWFEAFHPADVLATALCLGAFAALVRERLLLGAGLLGLALATRQWAIIALALLVVLAGPAERVRLAAVAVAVAVLVTLPLAIAAPRDTFEALAAKDVVRSQFTAPALLPLPDGGLYLISRYLPLVLAGALCAWLYGRRARLTPELAVAVLAAGLLLRPLTDPAGFLYYLAPGYAFFVLVRPRSLRYPIAGLLGGLALAGRVRLAHRYQAIEGMFLNEGGHVLLVGGTLSVLTSLVIAAAVGAAIAEVRSQV